MILKLYSLIRILNLVLGLRSGTKKTSAILENLSFPFSSLSVNITNSLLFYEVCKTCILLYPWRFTQVRSDCVNVICLSVKST